MPPRMTAIELIVDDMPAALAFYRRLGLDIPADADNEAHAEIHLDTGVALVWDTVALVDSINPGYVRPTGSPRASLAWDCGTPAEVDALFSRLVDGGAASGMEPFDAPWGRRFALVIDPDGNGVELYAALA